VGRTGRGRFFHFLVATLREQSHRTKLLQLPWLSPNLDLDMA
jgi:hypothetical protein